LVKAFGFISESRKAYDLEGKVDGMDGLSDYPSHQILDLNHEQLKPTAPDYIFHSCGTTTASGKLSLNAAGE
jgi:hypothetical protein